MLLGLFLIVLMSGVGSAQEIKRVSYTTPYLDSVDYLDGGALTVKFGGIIEETLSDEQYFFNFTYDSYFGMSSLKIYNSSTSKEYIGHAILDFFQGGSGDPYYWHNYDILMNAMNQEEAKLMTAKIHAQIKKDVGTGEIVRSVVAITLIDLTIEENDYEQRITTLETSREDQETRLTTLESWQQTMDGWKDGLDDIVVDVLNWVDGLFDTTDDHETRITTLEFQEPFEPNFTMVGYWQYLDFRTKEDIACGWGEDNSLNLFKMQNLGASCEINRGCDCDVVKGECNLDGQLYCYSWEKRRDDLNLEIKNLGDDIRIESIEVEGCDTYDRDYRLREDRSRAFRIGCSSGFTEGDIVITYDGGVSTGHVNVS